MSNFLDHKSSCYGVSLSNQHTVKVSAINPDDIVPQVSKKQLSSLNVRDESTETGDDDDDNNDAVTASYSELHQQFPDVYSQKVIEELITYSKLPCEPQRTEERSKF